MNVEVILDWGMVVLLIEFYIVPLKVSVRALSLMLRRQTSSVSWLAFRVGSRRVAVRSYTTGMAVLCLHIIYRGEEAMGRLRRRLGKCFHDGTRGNGVLFLPSG